MSSENENKVGVKEYTALVMMCLGIKATDTTPVLFFKTAMNAGWVIPIISSGVVLVSLVCMLTLLKRYKNKNLIEIMYHLFGNYIALGLGLILTTYSTVLSAFNFRQYADIMTTIYFRKTPTIAIVLILVGGSCIIARFGFEAIGRISWMILPWIIVIVIAFIVLIYNLIRIDYLFPLGGAGVKSVLKGGVIYSGIFSELIFFAVVFPRVKSYKDYKISSFIGLAYGVVVMSSLSAEYLMVLDYPPIVINSSPFHTVARLIYGGRFISNLEAFFFLFWIIASILRFSMFCFVNAEIFSLTLRHKESRPLIIPLCALMMLIALMPKNFYQNAFVLRIFSLSVMWYVIYIIPCVLLFLSHRKGDYKK